MKRDEQSEAPISEFGRIHLHRGGLYALAGMQTRGDFKDVDMFERFFSWNAVSQEALYNPAPGDLNLLYFPFMPACFSGIALSSVGVPGKELRQMLESYQSVPKGGLRISPAILVLWDGREGDERRVAADLWHHATLEDDGKAKQRWEIIERCAQRMHPRVIKPYEEMLRDSERNVEYIGPTIQEPIAK
ncbi:hypothetical protein HYU13_03515 [Candidatus Woesearchaeota archaeon]|nr:hypothetical protein [Candidatus Woesearchaeota archaeon]